MGKRRGNADEVDYTNNTECDASVAYDAEAGRLPPYGHAQVCAVVSTRNALELPVLGHFYCVPAVHATPISTELNLWSTPWCTVWKCGIYRRGFVNFKMAFYALHIFRNRWTIVIATALGFFVICWLLQAKLWSIGYLSLGSYVANIADVWPLSNRITWFVPTKVAETFF